MCVCVSTCVHTHTYMYTRKKSGIIDSMLVIISGYYLTFSILFICIF